MRISLCDLVRPSPPLILFRGISTVAALISLVIVVTTLVFLIKQSGPALSKSGVVDFFTKSYWAPSIGHFGVLGILEGTIIIALIALLIAAPLGLGMALFINEYPPARLRASITSVIDLLAALPSLLFGMWGLFTFQVRLIPWSQGRARRTTPPPPCRSVPAAVRSGGPSHPGPGASRRTEDEALGNAG